MYLLSGVLVEIHRIRTRRRILFHLEVVGRQPERFEEHIAEVFEFAQHFGFQLFVALVDFRRQTHHSLGGLRDRFVELENAFKILQAFVEFVGFLV